MTVSTDTQPVVYTARLKLSRTDYVVRDVYASSYSEAVDRTRYLSRIYDAQDFTVVAYH